MALPTAHSLSKHALKSHIKKMNRMLRKESLGAYKRIATEILQYDATLKVTKGQAVGIDELEHLPPIESPDLLLTLVKLASNYHPRTIEFRGLMNLVTLSWELLFSGPHSHQKPQMFIVHGHDHQIVFELKNYLQNTLQLGTPIILHEQPSQGRTIIEKFERLSRPVDLVFVVLTPDDEGYPAGASGRVRKRARQNVIFEMGFFFSKFQRLRGRVLVLYKGDIELPSDISGIVYIDITNGIKAAGEDIRRELGDWLTKIPI